jgi:hypothetical protein
MVEKASKLVGHRLGGVDAPAEAINAGVGPERDAD